MRRPLTLIAIAAPVAVVALTGSWSAVAFVRERLTPNPAMTLMLATTMLVYVAGLAMQRPESAKRTDVLAFLGGVAVLGLAFLSPLDELGNIFFSWHMLQHLLVIIAAAPLLALGNPQHVLAETIPEPVRRYATTSRSGRALRTWWRSPAGAWCAVAAFAIAIAFWHIPAAHDWATGSRPVHELEHVSLVFAAVLFWRVILQAGRRRVSRGVAAFMVALIGLQGALISAVIMFAGQPLCANYAGNPLADQTLAGVLMCIPASFAYVGSTVWGLANLIGNGRSHA